MRVLTGFQVIAVEAVEVVFVQGAGAGHAVVAERQLRRQLQVAARFSIRVDDSLLRLRAPFDLFHCKGHTSTSPSSIRINIISS